MTKKKPSILAVVEEDFERQLQEREDAGDPTVAIHRFGTLWLLEQLGDPVSSGKKLAKLEDRALKDGRLRSF